MSAKNDVAEKRFAAGSYWNNPVKDSEDDIALRLIEALKESMEANKQSIEEMSKDNRASIDKIGKELGDKLEKISANQSEMNGEIKKLQLTPGLFKIVTISFIILSVMALTSFGIDVAIKVGLIEVGTTHSQSE